MHLCSCEDQGRRRIILEYPSKLHVSLQQCYVLPYIYASVSCCEDLTCFGALGHGSALNAITISQLKGQWSSWDCIGFELWWELFDLWPGGCMTSKKKNMWVQLRGIAYGHGLRVLRSGTPNAPNTTVWYISPSWAILVSLTSSPLYNHVQSDVQRQLCRF